MENEPDHASSMGQQHTTAAHFSHAGHGHQSLGHSVVPDLMKIYESLTQSKTPQTQQQQQPAQHHPQPAQQHQQSAQPSQQTYSNASSFYPPAPAAAPFPYQAQQYIFATSQPPDVPMPQFSLAVDTSNQEAKEVSSSGRTLRKRTVDKVEDDRCSSDGSTSRSRKKKKSDGRWSKRFTWPDDLHRDFVSAIFDVGLKHASPSALMEHMPEHDQITSERVKSHLQKYRLHRAKSKKEFMSCYEASLGNYQAAGVKTQSLGSGEVAAHLAYSTMTEPEVEPSAPIPTQGHSDAVPDSTHEMIGTSRGGALVLPKLTEAEKRSPIGASMGYMMGLFFALRQQLMANRAAAAASGDASAPNFVSYPSSTDAEQADNDGHVHDQSVAAWPLPVSNAMEPPQQHVAFQDQTSVASVSNAQAATSRTNLEESNLMKREMQNQMAFQNKMRALKQQELNKTKTTSNEKKTQNGAPAASASGEGGESARETDDRSRIKNGEETKDGAANKNEDGTSEESGNASRARQQGLSVGGTEDFWVNDEQLFEFLMNT